MSHAVYPDKFLAWAVSFRGEKDAVSRLLAGYSAAIALADEPALSMMIKLGKDHSLGHREFYEMVLQSHLFLGFPRMLIAAEHLADQFEGISMSSVTEPVTPNESQAWFENGLTLCRRVYGASFDPLRTHVEAVAPEVFRWMIIEGYGKVLSRPGVSAIDRELAIVACLIIENRPKQLHSHMRGALNVGADPALVRRIIEDQKDCAPNGFRAAVSLLDGIIGER